MVSPVSGHIAASIPPFVPSSIHWTNCILHSRCVIVYSMLFVRSSRFSKSCYYLRRHRDFRVQGTSRTTNSSANRTTRTPRNSQYSTREYRRTVCPHPDNFIPGAWKLKDNLIYLTQCGQRYGSYSRLRCSLDSCWSASPRLNARKIRCTPRLVGISSLSTSPGDVSF